MRHAALAGRHVLLVEDEFLIAMTIENALLEQGCVVVGPFGRLAPALDAAETGRVDLAILDVNLMGVRVYPLAEVLDARRVPFILATGYGEAGAPKDRPDWKVCPKPYLPAILLAQLAEMVAPA